MPIFNNESLFSNSQGDPLLSGLGDNPVDPFNNPIKPLESPPTGSELFPIDSQYGVEDTSLTGGVAVNSIDSSILPSSDNNSLIDPLTGEAVGSFQNTDFISGTFVVGNTGQVSIQFLYDGGAYKSEIGIFSLTGMEELVPGSTEFIKEAARRASSHSEQGYIVISDATEAAKFTGELGEANNFNWGEHEGNKTFLMQPGDKFGIILVPNGTIEEVEQNPELAGNKRPLFSLATANPEDAFHVGQIADVTGEGNLFVMEDLRVDVGSDRDYNDLIFSLFGATGTATVLDDLINPNLDWRTTPIGQEIITYVQEQSALLQSTPESDSEEVSETVDALEPSEDEIVADDSTVESTLDIDSTDNGGESTLIPEETESSTLLFDETIVEPTEPPSILEEPESSTLLSDEITVEPTESTSIPEEIESSILLPDDTDNEIESTSVPTETSPSNVGDSDPSNLTESTSISTETSETSESPDETSTVSDSDTVEPTEFADESGEEETSNAIQSDEDILAESPASSDSATTPASAEETPDSEESSLDSTETNSSSLTTDDTDLHGTESVPIREISVQQSLPNFSQGVFQVGETGAINIEYIFDGGYYQGTVGLFNLAGLSEYEWGSPEFFQEIARRSLSNSDEGYVLINDSTEAAKLDGKLEAYNWNRGIKPGEKTFSLPEGTEFGLILIPDGTLQELFDNPQVTGSKKPILSLTPSDPERALHQPQLVDVTGDGSLFAWEDLRLPGGDTDFNDIIFKMSGATGIVPNLDEVIAPDSDWRNSQIGQQIVSYAEQNNQSPIITAKLAEDTGISDSDRKTYNPTITGTLTHPLHIVSFTASFDNSSFTNIDSELAETGDFTLTPSQLATIYGDSLPDGSHTLYLQATDKWGNITEYQYDFTLDTTAPPLTFDLDPASDTDIPGDAQTAASPVTLIGTTEPNATVTLIETGTTVTADTAGQFSFAGIDLTVGENSFTIQTLDDAGNSTVTNRIITRTEVSNVDDIVLVEGENFSVSHREELTIPQASSQLVFTLVALNFDRSDSNAINDAFEVALLDAEGNSLVHTIGSGDAFFNLTDGEEPKLAAGVEYNESAGTVTLNLNGVSPGNANLVLRLVNGDRDTTTSVSIRNLNLVGSTEQQSPVSSGGGNHSSQAIELAEFGQLTDITPSFPLEYRSTRFDESSNELYAEVAIRNQGNYSVDGPLLVAVSNISDPTVLLRDPDGFTPEGVPYYNFSELAEDGKLDPTEITELGSLTFFNPNRVQFTYELTVLGQLNADPVIDSEPPLEAIGGNSYRYEVIAKDANNDGLSYSLLSAPNGMIIDSETGVITWETTVEEIGTHAVVVEVVDSRGGKDVQSFTLSVTEIPPNRPPIFTSTPVVDAYINQPYRYDSNAMDPDGDPLSYRLIQGPEDMTVDPVTGEVEWTPPPVMMLGDTVLGRISIPGGRDEFSFSGTAGQRIYIDPLQYGNWQFELYDPNGKQVTNKSAQNIDSGNVFTLTETGNYSIVVNGNQDFTGSYGFTAIDVGMVPVVPFDEVIRGTLSPGTEDDVYRFTGQAGQKLFLDRISESEYNVNWVLYKENDKAISSSEFYNYQVKDGELYLPYDGEYVLTLQGNSTFSKKVDYAFEIITPEEITTEISVGTHPDPYTILGEIGEKGEEDYYTFTGTPGQRLYLDFLTNSSNLQAEIISPSGQSVIPTLSFSTDYSQPITLSESGTYRVRVDGKWENTGSYEFSILDVNRATEIEFDTQYSDTLVPGRETHLYQFSGSELARLYIDKPGWISGIDWKLYDSSNKSISYDSTDSDMEVVLSTHDTYTLAVRGTGDTPVEYSFEVITPERHEVPLVLGDIYSSNISEKGERDVYSFTGTKGQLVFLDTLVDANEIKATLTSPSGKSVIDTWMKQDNSRKLVILPEYGTYELNLDGLGEEIANYSFQLIDLTDISQTPQLETETLKSGTLNPGESIQFYQFSGLEGTRIYFDTQENSSGARWQLYSSNELVDNTSYSLNQDFEKVLPGDGTYYLMLSGDSSDPVSYNIQIVPTLPDAASLSLNTPIFGDISKLGERDTYTFEGQKGQTLYFDPRIGDEDITIQIYNSSGNSIFDGDTNTDGAPFTLTQTGTYKIVIDGDKERTGNYSFILTDTASSLPVGTPFTGSLAPQATQLYEFSGEVGQTFQVNSLNLDSKADWELYAIATGSTVASSSLDRNATVMLPTDGSYILALRNSSSNSENYGFQFQDISAAPVTTSGIETIRTGSISTGGEVDDYFFTANAGTLIYFDGLSRNGIIGVRLQKPDGSNVFSSQYADRDWGDSSSNNAYQLTQTGTYKLQAYGLTNSSTGDYSFKLIDVSSAPILNKNAVMNVSLNPNETKAYKFNGTLGEKLLLDGLNSNYSKVTARILNSGGQEIASTTDLRNDSQLATLKADGEYYLVLQSNNSSSSVANFRLLNDTSVTPIAQTGNLSGNFGNSQRETHLYRFIGTEGQRLYVDSTGGSWYNRYSLYSSDGREILSNYPLSSDSEIETLPTDGEYILAFSGNGQASNTYQMQIVVPPADSESSMAIGTPVSGEISKAGQQNTYTFTGAVGQQLWFDNLINSSSISATLYSPTGDNIWNQWLNSSTDSILPLLTEAGTYRLEIDGTNDATGDYRFRMLDMASAISVNLDEEINGYLGDTGRETHLYRFTGTEGQRLYLNSMGGSRYNNYSLYSPDGELRLSFGLNNDSQIEPLPVDGEYVLAFSGTGQTDNSYKVEIVTPNFTWETYSIGETVSDRISEAGEEDAYTFIGTPGQRLWLDSILNSSNITASLYAPSGKDVWNGNQYLSADRETFVLDEEGTYTLKFKGIGDNTGDYQFRLLDFVDATSVNLDEIISGDFGESNREAHLYRFTGTEGQRLYFDRHTGSSGNSYLLYNSFGVKLFSSNLNSDNEGTNNAAFPDAILPEDGEYTLVFSGRGSGSNTYDLEIVTPESVTQPIAISEVVSSEIGESGERDIYTFSGTQGQELFFDSLESSSYLLDIKLLDPKGNEVWNQDVNADRAPFKLLMDGVYSLVVDGQYDTTDSYRFRLLDVATASSSFDELVTGDFGATGLEAHLYRFDGNADVRLYFDSQGGSRSNVYALYDANLDPIFEGQRLDLDRELELPETGSYTLVLQGRESTTNDGYELKVVPSTTAIAPLTLGETVVGEISVAGEQNSYTFEGTVGQQLFFDALKDNHYIDMRLESPTGDVVITDNLSGDSQPFTLTESGTYRLIVDGRNETTGEYEFVLSDRAAVTQLSTDSTPVSVQLSPNETQLYRLEGTKGQVLNFDLDAQRLEGASWTLYGPNDRAISTPSWLQGDFQATLPSDGTYTLAIAATSTPQERDYNFSVTSVPQNSVSNTGLNVPISGNLAAGMTNSHRFTAAAGTQIVFDSLNNDYNNWQIRMRLVAPDGSNLFQNHDSRNDREPFTLPLSGEYELQVDGFYPYSSSDYQFQLLELPSNVDAPSFNPVEFNAVTTGTFGPGLSKQVYAFTGQVGQQILLNNMAGSNIKTSLYDPTGSSVFSHSSASDSSIQTLNQDGIYYLAIEGTQTTARDYSFQLLNFGSGTDLKLNVPTKGQLASGQQAALYKFTGEAGQKLYFDSLQGNWSNQWKLYGPGNNEQLNSNPYLSTDFEVELPSDGEYTLYIEGGSSATPVSYQFQVFQHENASYILTPGTGETASNADGSLGVFPVQLSAKDPLGAEDIQNYNIRVWPDPGNTPPEIESEPPTQVGLNQKAYRYQLEAFDPDGDSLRYRLVEAPLGAIIDGDRGELLWFPESAKPGDTANFTVEVNDARGGTALQSFTVDVYSALGNIQGAVFDDLNGNGYRDTTLVQGDSPNIVFAIDVSGSTGGNYVDWTEAELETVADEPMGILGMEIATAVALSEQLILQGRGDTTQIAVVPFNDGAGILDLDPSLPGVQLFTTPLADKDGDGVTDLRQALNRLNANSGTYFTPPLEKAEALLNSVPGDANLIFLSDGFGGVDTEVVDRLNANGVNITAFGIGAGAGMGQLQKIDPDAIQVTDPREIIDIFGGWDERYTPEPLMENVTVYLDLNENGQLDDGEPTQLTGKNKTESLLGSTPYHFTFDNLLPGTYTVRQLVPNGYEETAPTTGAFVDTITVTNGETFSHLFGNHLIAPPPNSIPAFISTAPTDTIEVGEAFKYQANAIDADAEPLTYELTLFPEGMNINPESGTIIWRPTEEQTGTFEAIVRVSDSSGGIDLQYFQVEVVPPNSPPTFTTPSPTSIQPQRGKLFEYRLNALDVDGDADIRYELVNPPTGATLNPDTGILRWTPSQTGQFQFSVKAIDSLGGEASQTITATVVEPRPNTPPEITTTPGGSVRIGSTYLYQLPLTDSDGDPLTFNFLQSPNGMEVDEWGRIVWTPTPNQFGSHPISLEVSDGEDATTLSWTLNVSNQTVNRAPSITSTPNLITNLERVYQYQLEGFDPDGDLLLWTLDKAPSGMVIDPNSGMLSWQPNATQLGEHTIAIRVTDATGYFVGQEFDLTVRGINTPPSIVSVPITAAAVGQEYRYQIASTDIENDGGRYSLGIVPSGMQIEPETGLITWTPTAQQTGSVSVEVLVSDTQGSTNRQTYTIEVGSDAINHPPVITSTAKYFAATGVPYRYQIEATDADNDALIYQPISVPNGMTLDANTGELRWDSPTFGTHQVVVGVNDGSLGAAQGFTLTVQNDLPPVFNTNEPPTVAIPNRLFSYDIQATDPNGSSLTYRLDDASIALGMTVDELGRLRWTPTVENVGTHAITIEVMDELGTTATQTFNLTVAADNVAPQIQLLPSNVYLVGDDYRADIGSEITFFFQATDNVGITGMQLFINDEPVELSGLGTAKIKVEEFGKISVRAVAYDAALNTTESTLEITAIDSSDPDSPVVALAEGLFDETVTAPLEIVGTVEDENLDYYTLEVAAGGSGEFREIFRGTESVVDGVLGTFDPSILQNDSYVLRLSAYDKGGNGSTIEERLEVGGEKQGNLNLSFNDLVEIPITGFPIILTRTYDSLNAEESDDFGYGWRMELVDTDLRTNVPPPSFEQELLDIQNAFTDDTRVYVTLPDGERIDFRFEPTGDRLNSFLSLYGDGAARWYHPTFVADNGSGMTLSVPDTRLILGPDGNYYDLAGVPYNPENSRFGGQYTLTTPEGVVAEIDAKSGDLLKVTDADGYSLTFSDAGIFSSTGEAIALGRDAKGRINTVTDFNNQVIRYQYDEKGDLVAVTDRDNVTTHFDYHQSFDHYLTSVLDPLGRSGANAFYDENGRLQLLLQDGTDLLTNQAPILINDSVLVSANLPATIDLSSLVTDPDSDRVTYHISNALNGTAELLADGTTLSFQPDRDFVGTASFDLVANDGGVRSVNETITVKVSDAPLLSLDVVERDVQLRSDGTTNLVVTANFADRKGVVIPASELTYSTDNPDLVTVESDGMITAKNAEGVAVVRVSYRDEEAVTAIRIGATPTPTNDAEFNVALAEFEGIDPYPDAITLVPGAKRQLQLRLNSLSDSPDLSAAASGTRYYVSDENVVQISEDGKITALSSGYATVTVVHGAAEETIEVRVVEPISGTASIGVNGGAVRSDDGAIVMVPPGALTEETPVSIGQIEESNLSLEIPEKFSFAGGFNLDIGEQPLEFPLQLAIPAPAGVEPGTEVFFLRKGELPALQQGDKWVGSETMHPIWTMVESGIVGDDGMIYTTSPPWRGAYESGEYSIAIPKFDYSVAHLRLAGFSAGVGLGLIAVGGIALAYPKLSPLTYSRPDYFVPGGLIGAGALALASVPVLLDASERTLTTLTIPTVGLPYTTELNVSLNLAQLDAGRTPTIVLDVPTQPVPDTQPVLERLQLQYDEQQGRVLYLEGRNFGTNLDDLEVNFHLGGKVYPGTILPSLSAPEQERIAVTTDFVPLAEAEVSLKKTTHSVIDTQTETETERVKIPIDGCVEMAMVPRQTSDTISLVNTLNPEQVIAQTDSKDLLLADIPVGSPNREDGPRAIAATSNASRAYVTLNQSAQVALVDLTAFKQLDAQPDVEGINGIDLPYHAIPSAIAINSRDEYAYVGDWKTGAIYVIDINPSSDFYNQYIGTIEVENASLGLRQLAMSSDGTRLFATTPGGSDTGRGQILVFNIDPRDRPDNPADPNQNTRKWHQQIGRVEGGYGVEGLAATYDPTKMVFTSRGEEPKGYGVLTILNNDPLSFEAVTHYAQLTLGGLTDYFDVNEAVSVAVMYDEESGTDYAFVAGRNGRMIGSGIESVDGSKAGGNIGIIKDALGPNPTLVAATRPIPNGFTNGVSLSSDNKYLTASYPGIESTFVFNVKEMLQTVNSTPLEVFEEKPIDDINPSISLAADFKDIGNAIDSFTRKIPYGVPNNSHTGPISLGGGSPFSVATASSRPIVNLQNPIGVFDEETLTPTFKWNFNGEGDETDVCATPVDEDDVKEVRLYVSVFPEGEGLLSRDIWPELDSPTPGRDYNPNRILTATWKEGVWTWNGGSQAGAKDQFTLPDDRMLTAGQEYYWAVEAVINGSPTPVVEDSQFKTPLPPSRSSSLFTSVTVLTRGVEPQNDEEHNRLLDSQINAIASKIQEAGGSVMKYNPSTGGWQSVTLNGNNWVATNATPIPGQPLVLLADWMQGLNSSSFYNAGFAEAAADSLFASLVKLDQQYGGKVGEGSRLYDANGNLIRTQGDIFNSPLHFIGLGQGAVVNTEIIQRLGTYFPHAGGTNASNRDLQMTTIDPYDYDPTFPEPVFSTILDPEVVVWDNVTYADNYYQNKGTGNTLNGKELSTADWNVNLGSWASFDQNLDTGGPHQAAAAWYAGTADLNLSEIPSENGQTIYRRLGDLSSSERPWHTPDHTNANFNHGEEMAPWEGIGTGWFHSVLGGGNQLRPLEVNGMKKNKLELGNFEDYLKNNRVRVTEDNTYTDERLGNRLRGDYAVPTLFNGNFDGGIKIEGVSQPIPGWSLYEDFVPSGEASTSSLLTTEDLVKWGSISSLTPNYVGSPSNLALKLKSGDRITHDPFVIPDWGALRFDVHFPSTRSDKRGELTVTIKPLDDSIDPFSEKIELQKASNLLDSNNIPVSYEEDKYKIDYGNRGFESFYIPLPDKLRGQAATLELQLVKNGRNQPIVYLDNVFFQSNSLNLGNPTDARTALSEPYGHNYLLEKPQYSLSYNGLTNTPNWVSWVIDKSWVTGNAGRAAERFAEDPDLPASNFYKVKNDDYGFETQIQEKYNKEQDYNRFYWSKQAFFWANRGHLTPSNDRQRSTKDNLATFLTTNIIPQDSKQNSGVWRVQEEKLQDLAKQGYQFRVFAGGAGQSGGVVKYGPLPDVIGPSPINRGDKNPNQFDHLYANTTINEMQPTKIKVPDALWKAVFGYSPYNNSDYPDIHFAWWIPNNSYAIQEKLDYSNPIVVDGQIQPNRKTRSSEDAAFTISIETLEARLNREMRDINSEISYDFLGHIQDIDRKKQIKELIRLLPTTSG